MTHTESMTSRGRRPGAPSRRRAGFTLIEVLVAITILAVGVLGITMLQVNSVSGEILTREMDSAVSLAYDAIDRVQTNFDNIADYDGFTVTAVSSAPVAGRAGEDHDALQGQLTQMHLSNGTLTVDLQRDVPVTGVDTVTVTVTWNYKGSMKQCAASSVILS
ncbi:MAG: type IV pilus modification PilV family protein [Candidatus Nitrospinota bacterium M3_3B_026]